MCAEWTLDFGSNGNGAWTPCLCAISWISRAHERLSKEVLTALASEHLCAMVLTRHKRITAEFVGACPHGLTFRASQTPT